MEDGISMRGPVLLQTVSNIIRISLHASYMLLLDYHGYVYYYDVCEIVNYEYVYYYNGYSITNYERNAIVNSLNPDFGVSINTINPILIPNINLL